MNSGSSKETGTSLTFRARKTQANAVETPPPRRASEGEASEDPRGSPAKAQHWVRQEARDPGAGIGPER